MVDVNLIQNLILRLLEGDQYLKYVEKNKLYKAADIKQLYLKQQYGVNEQEIHVLPPPFTLADRFHG
jgi:hypothetical protein